MFENKTLNLYSACVLGFLFFLFPAYEKLSPKGRQKSILSFMCRSRIKLKHSWENP